ncbi:efflux RND transporter periplasmic adaptor subunit [Candidatus Latescibacterota bacterium]
MKLNIAVLKKLRKRPIFIGAGVFVIILFIIMISLSGSTPSIATYKAQKGEFIIDIQNKGELKAAKSTSVGVPRRVYGSTRITRIVEDGATVKEGDFLVQFDTSEFENRVSQEQNALENAKAELISQQASIESRKKEQENNYLIQQYDYEKAKLQYQQMKYEAAARQRQMELDFKKAELNLQQAKEKLESQKIIDEATLSKAELQVKQAELKLKVAQEMLESLTLTAPLGGMVVLQEVYSMNGLEKVKVGSTPYPGMDIVQIPDLSVMQVKTQVNEIDIGRVKVGQQVIITLDALEGPTFYGNVTNVATLARTEIGSDEKIFDMEVTIDGEDKRLKPGMTAQCKVVTDKIENVLYVPLEAVFEKEDTTIVYIREGGYNQRAVKVGAKNSDYIIIAGGVSEGEEVALRDPTLPLEELGVGSREESSGSSDQNTSPSLSL